MKTPASNGDYWFCSIFLFVIISIMSFVSIPFALGIIGAMLGVIAFYVHQIYHINQIFYSKYDKKKTNQQRKNKH
tara:strand:- start:131 stop:355 length:225 start_codon:yes stop_codon:yes gene_type:complete